jgi:hypothetical protein
MKSIEDNFTDWESGVFGYGYGTGEEHTLRALKDFLAAVPQEGSYDYRNLEAAVSAPVAWLLISVLTRDEKIEYGTSSRYGWLTESGKALKEFVSSRTLEQLYELTSRGEDYCECYPEHCNCGDGDCRPSNPFWAKRG